MKILHIVPPDVFMKHRFNFGEHHFVNLPSGRVLTFSSIPSANAERLEAEGGVLALPHPFSNEPIGPLVAEDLKSHGVSASDTSFQVLTKLKKHHAGFNPTRL